MNKKCSKCGTEKPATIEFFHRARYLKSGLSSWCKECKTEYTRNNIEKKRKYGREYEKTSAGRNYRNNWRKKNIIKYLLYAAKKRCEKTGVYFNINPEDVVVSDICPLLGIKLEIGGARRGNSPSLDRVDPEKGYIRGNVRIISCLANNIKTNATANQIKMVAKNIDGYIEGRL